MQLKIFLFLFSDHFKSSSNLTSFDLKWRIRWTYQVKSSNQKPATVMSLILHVKSDNTAGDAGTVVMPCYSRPQIFKGGEFKLSWDSSFFFFRVWRKCEGGQFMVTCFHNNEKHLRTMMKFNIEFSLYNLKHMWEILPDQIGQVFAQKQQQIILDVVENDHVSICF